MKKHPYDQEDKLFRQSIHKNKHYEVSAEDRELFKEWINNNGDNSINKTNIAIKSINNMNIENTTTWDMDTLFKNWVDKHSHKIDQYTQHKKENNSIKLPKDKNIDIHTIDLHGYTTNDALRAVKTFIKQLPYHTKKARIIHGKGLSQGKPSIIRNEIREWLSYEKKHHTWLIDFSYEKPEHGGHGATVIWVKQGVYHEKY